jgi:hypothetical protein
MRRRRVKRVVAFAICLLLFAGGVWTAVHLAMPRGQASVRVVGSESAPAYSAGGNGQSVIVHEPASPGQPPQDIEVQGTDQGVLIRPAGPANK